MLSISYSKLWLPVVLFSLATAYGVAIHESENTNSARAAGASSSDIQAYLNAHNTFRAEHGAKALTWSTDAASQAQQWADGCKDTNSGGTLGENNAAGTGSFSIAAAVKEWTDESSQYDPKNPTASHFTQVVWKATTQVGCGVQTCNGLLSASEAAKFYVCMYSPAGNVEGQFAANVQV